MLADWCEEMRVKSAGVGGLGVPPQEIFWDFWPSEVVSDAILG